MKTVPLFGTGFKSRAAVVSAQERTNLYIVPAPAPDKASFTLACTPGLTQYAHLGSKPSRGALSVNGYIYTVNGDTLWRIGSAGNANVIGTLDTSVGPVSMAWNGIELCVVDGTDGWLYTPSSGVLAKIVGMPTRPVTVAFLASRFIVNEGGSGRIHWSGLLDGGSWESLDFATAESETDDLVAVASDHGVLLLLGTLTTEFWQPTEDSRIFARIGGAGAEWGCASAQSVVKYDTGLAWLARNQLGEVRAVRSAGGEVKPVDTPETAAALNDHADIPTATALSYVIDGQSFLQINFAEKSYLFDGIGWSFVSTGLEGGRHLANFRAALDDTPYVFAHDTGAVYRLDKSALTDGALAGSPASGATIVREVVTKHLVSDFNPMTVWELYVNCEVGVSDTPLLTHDAPQMMLQVSKDGGLTWGNEIWSGMGNVGNYLNRVIFRRLGRARDWVFKLRVTDPVRVVLVAAALTAE